MYRMFGFGGGYFKHFMPHQPFGDFKLPEIRDLIFLYAIQQEKDGLTGYTLHKLTGMSLTHIYRILDGFEKEGYLTIEEDIEQGRAQKLYKITKAGERKLRELQEEWAGKVMFLQKIVPPCAPFPFPRPHRHDKEKREKFKQHIQKIDGKEDALQFLRVYLDSFDNRIKSMEVTIEVLKDAKEKISQAVDLVKNQEDFSSKAFVNIVTEIYEEIEAEVRSTFHKHRGPPSPPYSPPQP